jgi:hypothetical protein
MPKRKWGLVYGVAGACVMAVSFVQAASLLSEREAREMAVSILKGDPYGRTVAIVEKNIRASAFYSDGNTKACGAKNVPAWEFHVVVVTQNKDQFNNGVIDGYLALDARTGKLLCHNLPLLD